MPLKIVRKNNELIFNSKRYRCLSHGFELIKKIQSEIYNEEYEHLIDVHTNGLVVHLGDCENRNDLLAILDDTIEADSLATSYDEWLLSLFGPKMYSIYKQYPILNAYNMQIDASCAYEDGTWKV